MQKADPTFVAEVDAYIDEVWGDVVDDMATMIAVDSVEDIPHAEPGKPWGPGPYEALSRGLAIAGRLGLDAHDCEGYLGYADLPGASAKQVATIAHADIVPVGTGWSSDPFTLTRRDGYLFGRGILDDKGPLVLSLYAAHFFVRKVQATGEPLPYTLRCILGSNEETGMGDVEYYLERYPQPDFLFTPDADFPVCCGEKGLYGADLRFPVAADGVIVELDGGTVSNAIPSVATAVVRADAPLAGTDRIEVVAAGEGLVCLIAHGIGGHASMPEGTVNAIGLIVDYLLDNGLFSPAEKPFLDLEHLVFAAWDGSALGIDATDDIFEPLTIIGGTIRTEDGEFCQSLDCRYPKSTTGDAISARLAKLAAEHGVTFCAGRDVVPFYVDPTSPQIQTLVGTYNEFTGSDAQAFTIGGGTYARHFKNAASFGPNDRSVPKPDWVGEEHGPDEGLAEDQLRLALKIYIVAIARLMELDL